MVARQLNRQKQQKRSLRRRKTGARQPFHYQKEDRRGLLKEEAQLADIYLERNASLRFYLGMLARDENLVALLTPQTGRMPIETKGLPPLS